MNDTDEATVREALSYCLAEHQTFEQREVCPACRDNRQALAALARLVTRLCEAERDRDLAKAHDSQPYPTVDAYETVCRIAQMWKNRNYKKEDEITELMTTLKHAAYVAKHLHAMIDRETWRAAGADDGQGHYEGDYHAEQALADIESWVKQ